MNRITPVQRISERTWVRSIVPLLQAGLQRLDPSLIVEDGRKLPYAHEVRSYEAEEASRVHGMRYETDLLIGEKLDESTWVPRVVVEAKLRAVTTHDAITYSQKAATHKQVHPYLRYGILLGARNRHPLPGRLFRHGAQFDFMLSWQGYEPIGDELVALVDLVHGEAEASRQLEDIFYNTRGSARASYTILHRPLILGTATALKPAIDQGAEATRGSVSPAAKYKPLQEYLEARQHLSRVEMAFSEIAEVIGAPLPASAYNHRAWWSNQVDVTNRPQAAAWIRAGFEVASVQNNHSRVEFVRRNL